MTEPDSYPHDLVGPPAEAPTDPTPAEVAAQRAADAAAGRDLSTAADGELFAAPWRVAGSLLQLRAEANAANPGRDKASDGTIGNAAHAATPSDHNPNGAGVVRALDLDVDGLPLAAAVEAIRVGALTGRLPQMSPGGYVILNRRITNADFSGWHAYTGPDPHTSHAHVSCSTSPARYDVPTGWGVFPSPGGGGGYTGPDLTGSGLQLRGDIGNNGDRVAKLQRDLNRIVPAYSKLVVDGWWGNATAAVLDELGRRSGIPEADGRNIGPRLASALYRLGVRP